MLVNVDPGMLLHEAGDPVEAEAGLGLGVDALETPIVFGPEGMAPRVPLRSSLRDSISGEKQANTSNLMPDSLFPWPHRLSRAQKRVLLSPFEAGDLVEIGGRP